MPGGGVTNGVAWAKFADNTTNGATPDITAHDNWTASAGAAILRAEIHVAETAYFANTPYPNTYTTVAMPNHINDQTNTTVVGKKMVFTAKPDGADSYEWGVGGSTVSNFVVTATNGGPVFDFPKTNQTLTFAWWKPGTNVVTLKVKIGGQEMNRTCTFIVVDPPISVTTEAGNIALDNNYPNFTGESLHFGVRGDNPGVKFTHNHSVFSPGNFQWVQIVNSSVSKLKKQSGSNWKLTASGLDGEYPLSTDNKVTDSPVITGWDDEAQQGESLGAYYTEVSADDSFTMFLMYKPERNDVWVPFKQVDWTWNARAVNGTDGWTFPLAPTSNVPAAVRATGWPSWNKIAQDSTWEPIRP